MRRSTTKYALGNEDGWAARDRLALCFFLGIYHTIQNAAPPMVPSPESRVPKPETRNGGEPEASLSVKSILNALLFITFEQWFNGVSMLVKCMVC